MKNLVLYGSQNLNNKKFSIESISNFRGNLSSIQSIDNARFPGSTIVDKKVGSKQMNIAGTLRATDNITLQAVINEYSRMLNKEDRYFRVSTNYHVFTPMADETGWQVAGDTTVISFDNENFQYGDGSVKFDADVSVGNYSCSIVTEQGTEFSLAPYGTAGAFEGWVYLSQVENIAGITLKLGNDSSNYYSSSVTSQYDETPFENGWNYVSYRVADMDVTGTIDPYGIGSYISIEISYGVNMEDETDFRVGGILWQEESRSKNYRAYVENFYVDMQHYDITRADFNLTVFAYEGVAESTGTFDVLGIAGSTTATASGTMELEGTYSPLPVISIGMVAATNVSAVTLSNTTTGDSVAITRTYAAGENLVIDTDNREVTVNASPVDYDDVLPRFVLGENEIQISITTTGEESVEETTQDINLTGEV